MNDIIKIALIVAATVLIAVGMVMYFSPYQSCVRSMMSGSHYDVFSRQDVETTEGYAAAACRKTSISN